MGISFSILQTWAARSGLKHTCQGSSNASISYAGFFDLSKDLSSGCVYILRSFDSLSADRKEQQECCAVLCEGADKSLSNIFAATISIEDQIAPESVLASITAFISEIDNWVISLQKFILDGQPMQQFLDVSTSILKNHIAVIDSSLKLLCSTKDNLPEDDPITCNLIEHGFHTEATINQFRKARRFEEWERSRNDVIINSDKTLSPYTVATKLFKFKRIPFAYVVMTCNIEELTPGSLELFKILLDSLEYAIKQEWMSEGSFSRPFGSLIEELIENSTIDIEETENRLNALGIPSDSYWFLASISGFDPVKDPVGRIMGQIAAAIGEETIIYHSKSILVLKHVSEKPKGELTRFRQQLNPIVRQHNMRCGISARFHGLRNARQGYLQSLMILESVPPNTKNMAPIIVDEEINNNVVYTFDECFPLCLLSICAEKNDLLEQSMYGEALRRVESLNTNGEPDDIELLFIYLTHERNASKTGEHLFTHRNNILYRIKKIENALGLDIDDLIIRYCVKELCALRLYLREPKAR